MPKKTQEEKDLRHKAIEDASKYAMEIPMRIMEKCLETFDLVEAMVTEGNPNSVTDAGVGALCARTAIMGAYMNVQINGASIEDKEFAARMNEKGKKIQEEAVKREQQIVDKVYKIIATL